MQYKIDEIMALVYEHSKEYEKYVNNRGGIGSVGRIEEKLKSKLRELVREPLTEQEISIVFDTTEDESEYGTYDFGFFKDFTRNVERAHNITNTSGGE